MPGGYANYQNTLIDSFFHEQDQRLLQAFRERTAKMDRRAQLAAVSGIYDEAVLDRLIELDIGPDTLAAMSVVPLVCVAWADKKVQDEERRAIIAAAEAAGVKSQDGRYPLLEFWLTKRPGAALIDAWKHYIQSLCGRLERADIERLKHDLLDRARDVAQAAGGFLGIGNKVSAAEQAVLAELEQAFAS
jgi:hypothetical protein